MVDEEERLHRESLNSTSSAALLGAIAVRELLVKGIAVFYLDNEGFVAVAPPEELTLDALPEPMAIQTLINNGYTDEQLEDYLRGRDARMGSL